MDKQQKIAWKELVALFHAAKTKKQVDQLLHLFLTISERESLADRYGIIKELLTSDLPQREISQKIKVSIAKITAGSNELKTTSAALKSFLKKEMSL